MSRVLVTGGRKYDDRARVFFKLSEIYSTDRDLVVIQGGAPGADYLAKTWCQFNGVPCIQVDAAWGYYSSQAGGLRNQWMLDLCSPNYVLHFPGGAGTADMCRRARSKGVLVYEG